MTDLEQHVHDGQNGHHLPALEPDEPLQNPGLPAHTWRPTDVDEAKAIRAERQVAGLFGLSAVCAVLFVVAYFTIDDDQTVIGLGAMTVALGLGPRPGPAPHRHRHHPVGPQADGRPRDRGDAAPGPVLRRGP